MNKVILIIIIILVIVAGYLGYQNYLAPKTPEVNGLVYKNTQYGFEITLPDSWTGYTVVEQTWQGNRVDNFEEKFSGPEIIIKNPKTSTLQTWQDIPIMVISEPAWLLIQQELVAVSAAPIGPSKIGQNAKYVFANPPRWFGFTDVIGWQEAIDAVKTFKAF